MLRWLRAGATGLGIGALTAIGIAGLSQGSLTVMQHPSPQPSAYPTLEEMVGISPIIFVGTVVGIRYDYPRSSLQPYTYVQFRGLSFVRRDAPIALDKDSTIEFAYAGGVRRDLHQLHISNQPTFALGVRYLVFLRGGAWRISPIPGVNQGYFELRGPLNGDPIVMEPGGRPLAGFVKGRPQPFAPSPQDSGDAVDTVSVRASELTPEEAQRLGLTRGSHLPPEEKAREARAIPELAEALDTVSSAREADIERSTRQSGILRLSALKAEILSLRPLTRGRYPGFEQVFLAPANPLGTLQARPPAKDGP